MANLLYLVHRLPYPPNKGDKVRSYHLLRHLLLRHRVFLGTFIDDPDDEPHVARLRSMCAEVHVTRLRPRLARLASLRALWRHEALTLHYYRDAGLSRWVREMAAEHRIDACVVFSSSMAQFADVLPGVPMLVDFVDVDSLKWTEYGRARRGPLAWLYRREGERLLAYERALALRARRSFFVTENETALFRALAPECATSVEAMNNGVDAKFFAPDAQHVSPFAAGEIPVVFTGAMDYWPNVDAMGWFVHDVMPLLAAAWPALRLHIVGRNPTGAVAALASANVVVTGTVADVRPYLQHAAIVVAPLRLARGIQNKVLEAMAMARPVVASTSCVDSIDAIQGTELLGAADAAGFATEIEALLRTPERALAIGRAGRARVLSSYDWSAQLARIDRHLDDTPLRAPAAQAALAAP